jgi:DNA-binding beta-propeller fold protein YncE
VSLSSRVAALLVAALTFLAALVVGLTTLALIPATASAAPTSPTAYVTNFGSDTVTPIDLATNTPGTRSPSATSRSESRSPPMPPLPTSPTKPATR